MRQRRTTKGISQQTVARYDRGQTSGKSHLVFRSIQMYISLAHSKHAISQL